MIKLVTVPLAFEFDRSGMSKIEIEEEHSFLRKKTDKEQKEALAELNISLNNGYQVKTSEVIKVTSRQLQIIILHKQELIPPPSEGSL